MPLMFGRRPTMADIPGVAPFKPGGDQYDPLGQGQRRRQGLFGRTFDFDGDGRVNWQRALQVMGAGLQQAGSGGDQLNTFVQNEQDEAMRRDLFNMRTRSQKLEERDSESEWSQRDREQRAREEWISSLPPEQQAAARADPSAAIGGYFETQALASAPITPYQQQQLELTRRGQTLDYQASLNRSGGAELSRADQSRLDSAYGAAEGARRLSDSVDRFLALNAREGTGELSGLFPSNLLGRPGERRAEMEALTQSMITEVRQLAREGSVFTDADARRFERTLPSVERGGRANRNIGAAIQEVSQNAQDQYQWTSFAAQNGVPLNTARSYWLEYTRLNPIYDSSGHLRADRPAFAEWQAMGEPDMRGEGGADTPADGGSQAQRAQRIRVDANGNVITR